MSLGQEGISASKCLLLSRYGVGLCQIAILQTGWVLLHLLAVGYCVSTRI